jgi:hypothetical protein
MQKSSCLECRFGVVKKQKMRAGVDKYGKAIFDYIPKYLCTFDNITHATDQIACQEYLGDMTLFEYLSSTDPQGLHDLLSKFNLRVIGSRNKFGFDIVGE